MSTDPKYSVIHFYTGVELVFKARLLHEHWALVVAKPESASLAKFRAGDFHSVSLQDAIQRLESIAEESLSKEERTCFSKVGNHRNQIVHFFHKGYVAKEPDRTVISEVAAEQFRAWVYVHRLLTHRWASHFAAHVDTIRDLNELIKDNKQCLVAKLELVAPEIRRRKNDGAQVVACDSCGLLAAIVEEGDPPLREARCLVCERLNCSIYMECYECETKVEFEDGTGVCANCGTEYAIAELLEQFSPACDPKEEPDVAYCPECDRSDHYTVVPYGDGYICLSCASTFTHTSHCGWCSEPIAGDLEDSYLTGCMMCEGRFGHDKD